MKQHVLVSTSFVLIIMFGMSSCKKDGVYNPKKKISKIYTQQEQQKKQLVQTWTWNDKKLSRIDYVSGYYELFEYTGKQISKINNSDGGYMDFIYDGSKISKIEYYKDKELLELYTFEHAKGKVSKIAVEQYGKEDTYEYASSSHKNEKMNVLQFILPERSCENLSSYFSQRKYQKSNQIDTSIISLTWYEKNVVKIIFEYFGGYKDYEYTITYNHDKKKNPLCGFLSYDFDDPVFGYSKNNITREYIADNNYDTWEYNYSYIYDDNVPIQSTRTRKIGTYNNTLITYYEYEN